MKTNSAIRQETLALMKGNWGSAVGVTIVLYLIIYAIALVSLLLGMFVGGPIDEPGETILGQVFSLLTTFLLIYPIAFAAIKMFLHFVRGEHKLYVGGLFKCFSKPYYGKSIGVYLLMYVFTLLWALLLIVPGIIKGLSYSLAPYISIDNPELSANQAIDESMKIRRLCIVVNLSFGYSTPLGGAILSGCIGEVLRGGKGRLQSNCLLSRPLANYLL